MRVPPVELGPWKGPEDTTAMQRLASRLWPLGLHPGGLGWAAAGGQLADPIVLADGGDVAAAGWAGLDGDEIHLQADPARPEVASALVEWAAAAGGEREGGELRVAVADQDEVLQEAVEAAGFDVAQYHAAELVGPSTGMFLDVEGVVADPPGGYRVRHVRDDELAARVEVHRAAWRPASLPWPPGTAPEVAPDATSRFTPELYERVRATWLYDQTLDLVVEAPEGALAACCICWWDPASGCAEIEPLGVVPEHRRRRLAGALCHGAAERVAARGGRRVYINSDPGMRYSVPAAAYLAAGFVLERRGTVYRRSRS